MIVRDQSSRDVYSFAPESVVLGYWITQRNGHAFLLNSAISIGGGPTCGKIQLTNTRGGRYSLHTWSCMPCTLMGHGRDPKYLLSYNLPSMFPWRMLNYHPVVSDGEGMLVPDLSNCNSALAMLLRRRCCLVVYPATTRQYA